MTNVKIVLAYDGTEYLGWQKTKIGPSIEEELQKALETILQHPITLQAASRTDKGVHARAQVINFFTPCPIEKLQFQLNSLLPKSIRIFNVQKAPNDFHPTLDVLDKTYIYQISTGPFQMPQERLYAWHVRRPLNFELMQAGATLLGGTHDFAGFTNQKPSEIYTNTIRTIKSIKITKSEQKVKISITGKSFLYKMVRNIVGTISYIGCQKLPLSVILDVLNSKDRSTGGITAPAHGLTLFNINYKRTLCQRQIF